MDPQIQAAMQKNADQYGISLADYQKLLAANPPVYQSANQGNQYGNTAGGQYMQSPGMTNALQTLSLIKQYGGGGMGQQQAPSSTLGQVSNDPMNAATNLGAAALGMPAIYNPTPGQIPAGSKGGVAKVASPVSSGTVPNAPTGPWNTTAGVMANQQQAAAMQNWAQHGGTGNPADAAAVEKQYGLAPGTVAQQFGTAAIPNPGTTPNAQGQLPGTPTPTTPANAAGSAPATPWATAPPAPGVDTAGLHNTALANAGMAMYAHFGGDPATASHADIADFHTQLQNAITGGSTPFGAAPAGVAGYTAGLPPGAATAGPKKMAAGGLVPGQGNQDSVPALLTPGEYVIPKAQAAQIFGGRTPIRMQDGGFVPDDQSPPEVRRQRLAVAAAQAARTGQSNQPTETPQSSSSGPSLGGYSGPTAADIRAQNAAVNRVALNSGGASGGGYNIPGGGGYIGASPGTGQSGYWYPNQSAATAAGDVGTGVGSGPGSGMPTQQAAGVISGLASGLSAAAQAYASSFKDWKIQPDAIQKFGNNVIPAAPAAQFTQEQVDAQRKQQQQFTPLG